ncbi:MoxR family ATPase [Lewinella sp. JB7]|uniref:AAA family ATPase n=1 Tax=Lewinella sp. JB7 TaxID=2962887 RepID=UPI0020C9513C|nr:MoxR family ATPase [Lewinella sp. JB7]MCP9237422.1 MoxR family ATPase [Lewinella sp. JB7]
MEEPSTRDPARNAGNELKASPEALTDPTGEEQSSHTLPPEDRVDLEGLHEAAGRIRSEVSKLIVGQRDLIDLLIVSLLAGGHALVEGVPGIAKTLTARLIAKTVDADYRRIQFTPDLMPSDVTGTTVLQASGARFVFHPGPVFGNLILIDEINRAPAKTQSALFEVMAEQQVTIDGTTHALPDPFFVIATQNPVDQEGTYRLPEAQLDRFLVRIVVEYPGQEDEREILHRFRSDFRQRRQTEVQTVLSKEMVARYRGVVERIFIRDELLDYIAALVYRTRTHPALYLGASPRASLAILRLAKAVAALDGRDFVTPDDIQLVAFPALNHRIILTPEREMEGFDTRDVIREILEELEIPR